MVQEMLAADELAPTDENALRATGYLVRNYKMLSREKWMQDTVEHTAMAFLGITLGCARCHDHMYDPILQKEYYQVRAIFEPHQVRLDRRPGQPDTKKDGLPRAYDADLSVPTYLLVRGDDRNPDKNKPLSPGVPEALGGHFPNIESVALPLLAHAPDKREFVVDETLGAAAAEVSRTRNGLAAARQRTPVLLAPSNVFVATSSLAGDGKALNELALVEIDAPLAEVRQKAIRATITAEKLEDAGNKESDAWKNAAATAAAAQREQAVLEARRNLLLARQAMRAGKPETTKKVADAEKALASAEA